MTCEHVLLCSNTSNDATIQASFLTQAASTFCLLNPPTLGLQGQGLNSSLEDAAVYAECVEQHHGSVDAMLLAYNKVRLPNTPGHHNHH